MRVNREDAKNYVTAGNYFQLKNDGDAAIVRFLFNEENDIDNYIAAVHVLEDKKTNRIIDVDCLRVHDEPLDLCPFCAEKIRMQVKFYIPLWDEDRKRVVWWTRSRGFIEKVVKQIREVDGDSIAGTPFKIIRSGAAGSFDTDYEFVQQVKKADDKTVDDFAKPEELKLEDAGLLLLSEDQMEKYLRTGNLPQGEVKTRRGRDKGDVKEAREDRGRRSVPAEDTSRRGVGRDRGDDTDDEPRVRGRR